MVQSSGHLATERPLLIRMKYKEFIKNLLLNYKISIIMLGILKKILSFFERVEYFYLESQIRKNSVVRTGPFKGLKYPFIKSYGSVFWPKITGVYESQIHKHILNFKKKNYDQIINIGAGEGYYAVGLALMFPRSKILAVDINKDALNFVSDMAKLNNVHDRIDLNDNSEKIFDLINPNLRNLIICDCEGSEFKIFNEDIAKILKNSDIIVEMHYPDNIEDCSIIRKDFIKKLRNNHEVIIENHERKYLEDFEFLKNLPIKYAKKFIHENRQFNQEWLIFYSESKK